jgi:hypothetical protein
MMATVRHLTSGSGLKNILSHLIFVEQRKTLNDYPHE